MTREEKQMQIDRIILKLKRLGLVSTEGNQHSPGLALEDRLLDADGDGADHAGADVGGVVVLLEVVAHPLHQPFAEGGQVGRHKEMILCALFQLQN